MTEFIRERVCAYTPMYNKTNSIWEQLEKAKKYGTAGMELLSFYDELEVASLIVAKEIRARVKGAGLAIPCFSAGATLVGEGAKGDKERIFGYIDMCEYLEIPYMHHTIYIPFVKSEITLDEEYIFSHGCEVALEIADYARSRGVKTLVEDQGLIFNGVENYSRLMEATGYRLGTVLDTSNIMFVDESAVDFARALAHNIDHVHIKDYKKHGQIAPDAPYYVTKGNNYIQAVKIGEGDVDFPGVRRELASAGYQGYISLEFDSPESDKDITDGLMFVNSIFG